MLLGGTRSVLGGSGRYLVVLGQNRGCQCEKMYGLHDLNHQIIEYSEREKSDYEKTYKRTEFPLVDPFSRRG